MAQRGGAARRYAQAVLDLAKQDNSLDAWLNDLKLLNRMFGTERAVEALEDPKLTHEAQEEIVQRVVPKEVTNPLVRNFMLLLVKRQRLALLPRIVEVFQEMYNKERGIVVADVTTAVPLDEAHQRRVAEQLSGITGGKTIELRLHTDPSILGGMVARIGDELLDASVATRLATLAQRLT
ncbi:MAG TPA: ATP synthase F1 subunit delta [Chloroflexia bacterium]|nr:ATP synthase F1 subunit delta [Chloroflexia bacterium]HYP20295.1 ATP synthase F1 subunit delta [Chloroflexia bacterium]